MGSANINQRSLAGTKDTEIPMGAYQPHHTWANKKRHPRGQEKEARREEKYRFTCKCSFLEIYNEQIPDLLNPPSTNLQIIEDLKMGSSLWDNDFFSRHGGGGWLLGVPFIVTE